MTSASMLVRCDSTLISRLEEVAQAWERSRNWVAVALLTDAVAQAERDLRRKAEIERDDAILGPVVKQRLEWEQAEAERVAPLVGDVTIAETDLVVEPFHVEGDPVNKGERGIRLVHKPTGITVAATQGRSQLENKGEALSLLAYELRMKQITDQGVTRGHMHKLVEVPGTRSPGRLLGTTEATFECVCGKSERRKVS